MLNRFLSTRQAARGSVSQPDLYLLGAALALAGLGWVMVGSASLAIADGPRFLWRQGIFLLMGLAAAFVVWRIRLIFWERFGPVLLLFGLGLLLLVLMPGIGVEANGSRRWLAIGPISLQPSELVKLFMVVYFSGYLVRRSYEVRTTVRGFFFPVGVLTLVGLLLLLEPDFGAVVILFATMLGMLFLGGARLWYFVLLAAIGGVGLAALAWGSPYRMERLTSFLDPWSDPLDSGYQLTQALIAFGRGEWFGVGLGNSIQKLFYLPEAHTDFLYAVLAEELGLVGSLAVIALFTVLVYRALLIGRAAERAGRVFGAYLAYGLGIWIGLQAFINLGVNMGVLPTKGLTLPLMSAGGSSIIVTCIAVALILRVDLETRFPKTARRGIK
ncbi:cell division-specific peptidoglycan biosynthesis regulator FtsW [Nitrosococcus oceani ATCC 19707]|uniref:Probable peptidoglycan glycosyltransferase FtsW n=2 Tax=Nitrosococcus oceani TaxID=1229 RepID=Q3J788_NITOC|nr:putative lipid II flippase FtsW [Nitrosococcus oceani]ABA59308.1 cell division-specific peptidoglycan biosynthesis regulator FtsW [Nitrosococcus oceani ATCC 19707]EDZ66586.1 cell division protein FtsW [Nitrosococcus oceani AFC27]KFI18336.1 cell division protein FtsW [Nitrosococcus oceani C-27]GEM21134.1 cell division protein FtsW [Nitrosococcus oceani]